VTDGIQPHSWYGEAGRVLSEDEFHETRIIRAWAIPISPPAPPYGSPSCSYPATCSCLALDHPVSMPVLVLPALVEIAETHSAVAQEAMSGWGV